MADYSVNETLERVLALERMKWLSDEIQRAREAGEAGLVHARMRERTELKEKYFKVVK